MSRLLILLLTIFSATVHAADTPRVLVSIKPIHSLVSELMQGINEPALLIDGYQSPHTFQLHPGAARKIAWANIIIWVGPTLETSLRKALKQADDKTIIQLTQAEQSHPNDNHLHINPHRWLDPHLAQTDITRITKALNKLYPEHVPQITANNRRLIKKLQLLDKKIQQRFPDKPKIPAILYHDAWHHFQRRYGITTHGIIAPNAHKQPGAQHLYNLSQSIESQRTQCLLIEPQFKPRYLSTLQKKHPLRIVTLDPLAAELPAGSGTYFQMMHNITQAFSQCQ